MFITSFEQKPFLKSHAAFTCLEYDPVREASSTLQRKFLNPLREPLEGNLVSLKPCV